MLWTRRSCSLTLHLKSGMDSIGTVGLSGGSSRYPSSLIPSRADWAYLEDWCRRLTGSFADVYVFTVPLYLPKLDADGKWRVVSVQFGLSVMTILTQVCPKHHEVIGSPPNVAVPTHFAKVVLTSKPSSPATPHIADISTGAFVLPNAQIPDEAPLESFVVPGMCSPVSLVSNS